jgi:hypothetical protein
MKSLFLATAAVAALVAAPAFAQDGIGSVGLGYTNSDVDVIGLNEEVETLTVDAGFAVPINEAWTVTLDGGFVDAFDGTAGNDNTTFNGRAHVSHKMGDMRVSGFAGASEVGSNQLWSVGGQAQAYLDNLTLSGSVAYETVDDVDSDMWSVAADAAYFISPNFRVNAGAGWSTAELVGVDMDAWAANVGTEYQFPGTGISVTAGYAHSELEDADLQIDSLNVGLRFTFGGDLQTRERAGADLGRTVAGVGAIANAF